MIFSTFNHKILNLAILILVEKISIKVFAQILKQLKGMKKFLWWGAQIVINVLKFNRN
jgi:hypothetical protein